MSSEENSEIVARCDDVNSVRKVSLSADVLLEGSRGSASYVHLSVVYGQYEEGTTT